MIHIVCVVISLLSLTATAVLAQTEEPLHYAITQPATVSLTLDGTLTLPADLTKPVPVVLLIAGSGPTDRDGNSPVGVTTNAFKMLADSLNRMGIAVARYDKRYSGTNVKEAAKVIPERDLRFDHLVTDAAGFIKQLQADKRFAKVIVAGHSEGSLVGMLAVQQTKADGFISLAGPGRNSADVLKEQLGSLPDSIRNVANRALDSLQTGQLVKKPPIMLLSLFRPSVQPYLISWMKYDPTVEIKKLTVPVLLINGKHDFQVPASDAERLKAARPDATLVLFDTMNHILKDAPEDRVKNMKTYADPTLPLTPGLATAIARFVKR